MSEAFGPLLHYVSLDGAGGVELQFVEFIARAKALADCHSDVVACGTDVHPLVRSRLPADLVCHREKYVGALKLPKWPAALRARRQAHLVARTRPAAVLIWNRLRDSENTLAAAGPARCIYWERGAAWFADETPAKRRFLAGVQAILCNSRAAERMLALRWGYRGQTAVVPNALRPALRARPRPARSGVSQAPVWRLGVVARLESIKGVALALHAVAHLKAAGRAVELTVAGDGPARAGLESLAARLDIADIVVFHGFVAEMPAVYDAIDLLVHPALREPFGQIVLEASAHGVPCVATGVDGLVEVVADGQTGDIIVPTEDLSVYAELGGDTRTLPPYVYDPQRDAIDTPRAIAPDRLAAAIAALLADDARYAAYSRAGIERVTAVFDFDQHVRRALHAIQGYIAHGVLAGPETS